MLKKLLCCFRKNKDFLIKKEKDLTSQDLEFIKEFSRKDWYIIDINNINHNKTYYSENILFNNINNTENLKFYITPNCRRIVFLNCYLEFAKDVIKKFNLPYLNNVYLDLNYYDQEIIYKKFDLYTKIWIRNMETENNFPVDDFLHFFVFYQGIKKIKKIMLIKMNIEETINLNSFFYAN